MSIHCIYSTEWQQFKYYFVDGLLPLVVHSLREIIEDVGMRKLFLHRIRLLRFAIKEFAALTE